MSLSPILYHYFQKPLPYARTLALQERIHELQLIQRKSSSNKDILLLLQHRPVYTAGRRQTEDEVRDERTRLTHIGADFVTTSRGGQLTYHGPGQLVGYPLVDLSRTSPPTGIREYICKMQKMMQMHLKEVHGIEHVPSDNTGVFLNPTTKVASIGVQVRHRLTTHGFSLNVTKEPLTWFDRVVACGLADVSAGCIEVAGGKKVQVEDVVHGIVDAFGQSYGRRMEMMHLASEGEVGEAISALESEVDLIATPWPEAPLPGS